MQTPAFETAEKYILNRLSKELSPALSYHGPHHTPDVMKEAMKIAAEEKLTPEEIKLLRVAIAFHDAGFIYVYQNHEEKGCEMAKEILPGFNFSEKDIELICGMIMATKIPQSPKNKLEKIIGDADLDYLGREDVYPIAHSLFDELKTYANLTDEKKWDEIQINFLKNHVYHTSYSQKKRRSKKNQYLQKLIKKWTV